MGHDTRLIRTVAAALTLVALLSAVMIVAVSARDQANNFLNPPPGATPPPHAGGMMGNGARGMMSGGMMGNANLSDHYDLRFLDEMIPHHEMAIMMVRMMIRQSTHPELRDLGQRIISGQQQQIDQMRAWRQQWYPNAPLPRGMMGGGMMGNTGAGMMGGAMMAGDRADRMFLQMMIPHHQRAINMGNDALTNAQHPELQGLARDIIAVQAAEITEMRGYLKAWYGITP